MELDIIYVVPVVIFVGIIWFVYRLGIEVGRDFATREMQESLRQRYLEIEQARTNVRPLLETLTRRSDPREK
jgi:hypothetical protein